MNQADFLEEEEDCPKLKALMDKNPLAVSLLKSIKIGNFPDTERAREALEIIHEELKKLEAAKHHGLC